MKLVLFDLDGTAIDSSHRTKILPDGKLDLGAWLADCTRENIMKDSLLPLGRNWQKLSQARPEGVKLGFLTSRTFGFADAEFLEAHGLRFDVAEYRTKGDKTPCGLFKVSRLYRLLKRDNSISRVDFFEDSPAVKESVEAFDWLSACGVTVNFHHVKAGQSAFPIQY